MIRNKYLLLLFLALFLQAYQGNAYSKEETFTGQETITKGLSLAYQLKLEEAENVFWNLAKTHPGSPAALFYTAVIKWGYTESQIRWERVAELYARTKPPKRPMLESEYILKNLNGAVIRCQKLLKNNPENFEAMFYLAGSHGFLARIEFSQGNYLSGMMNGKKSAHYFDKLLEKFPERGDAMLGPGVYKYYVGRLSAPMRFLISMLGLSGSKEEGISLVERAYENSILSSTEAADFLARIYGRREGNISKGMLWADLLEKREPDSPLADFHRLFIYRKTGNLDGQEKSLEKLIEVNLRASRKISSDWEPLLYFALGAVKEEQGDSKKAQELFVKAATIGSKEKWLLSEIKLWLDTPSVIGNLEPE